MGNKCLTGPSIGSTSVKAVCIDPPPAYLPDLNAVLTNIHARLDDRDKLKDAEVRISVLEKELAEANAEKARLKTRFMMLKNHSEWLEKQFKLSRT